MPPPIDAKTVRCPKPGCEAEVGKPCIRLSLGYGTGNPLRKAHNERWVAAHQAADRRAFGWNRSAAPQAPQNASPGQHTGRPVVGPQRQAQPPRGPLRSTEGP